MEYRRLGQSGLEVSVIGFGGWAIGGHGYGRVDDRESIRAIHRALDQGINFFDTADVYGFGHSEQVLGMALGSNRNAVTVATKFGVAWDGAGKTIRDCSPRRVVAALDASLKRLQIDCIPLYQIHWHDNITPIEDTLDALVKCQKAGKIGHIGCTNFDSELIRQAQMSGRLESLQCIYNPLQRNYEEASRGVRNEFEMGIIGYGLLGRGILSDRYDIHSQFAENDTRKILKEREPEQFKRLLDAASILTRSAKKYGMNAAQLAIRITLSKPEVTCGLVGMMTPEQVDNCVLALRAEVPMDDVELIDRALMTL
jgi:aryl-alcohol dehydrogenase-like predicted oxidoreductase